MKTFFSQSEKRPEMKNNTEGMKRETGLEITMIGEEEMIVTMIGTETVTDIEKETMDMIGVEIGISIVDEKMKRDTMSMGKCYYIMNLNLYYFYIQCYFNCVSLFL